MSETFDIANARELAEAVEFTDPDLSAALAAACDEAERLKAERDALWEAVEAYADKYHWWSSDYGDDGIWQDTWRPDKDGKHPEHGFERALAALRQAKGETE